MVLSQYAKAAAAAALLSWPIQAQALEIVGPSSATRLDGGMIQTVQHRHGGGVHVNRNVNVNRNFNVNRNVHVNGPRPGVPPNYRPGYRPPVVVAPPRAAWVGRPGWYRWAPGGAIAAGAALGFVTAAAAASWAGAPPHPGLCWYYTDPSRTQGFWDACP